MKPPRLQELYEQQVKLALIKSLGVNNPMAVPGLKKVVLNVGIAEEQYQDKALESMRAQLALITGQKPADAAAKKSIAEFKIRTGQVIGLKVTLRGRRMYQFMDKLVNIVLPQIKDFGGVNPRSFDGQGNYTLGLKEQIVFPELSYDTIDKIRGLEITIVTVLKPTRQPSNYWSYWACRLVKKVRQSNLWLRRARSLKQLNWLIIRPKGITGAGCAAGRGLICACLAYVDYVLESWLIKENYRE